MNIFNWLLFLPWIQGGEGSLFWRPRGTPTRIPRPQSRRERMHQSRAGEWERERREREKERERDERWKWREFECFSDIFLFCSSLLFHSLLWGSSNSHALEVNRPLHHSITPWNQVHKSSSLFFIRFSFVDFSLFFFSLFYAFCNSFSFFSYVSFAKSVLFFFSLESTLKRFGGGSQKTFDAARFSSKSHRNTIDLSKQFLTSLSCKLSFFPSYLWLLLKFSSVFPLQ